MPLATAPSRSLEPRPRPIPAGVKAACLMMIYEPTDFITAAKANGLKPETLRRWLHRPEVIGLLRKERAAFRAAICAGNERVLASIRDEEDGNQMARVHAIKTLEQLDTEATAHPLVPRAPGFVIIVGQSPPLPIGQQPPAPPMMVDVIPVNRPDKAETDVDSA